MAVHSYFCLTVCVSFEWPSNIYETRAHWTCLDAENQGLLVAAHWACVQNEFGVRARVLCFLRNELQT